MKNIEKIQFDASKAVMAAAYLRSYCDTTPCKKCPFHCAGDCTLRSSAPDAWTSEDWRSPEDI